MKKKVLSVLLTAAMLTGILAGCGDAKQNDNGGSSTGQQTTESKDANSGSTENNNTPAEAVNGRSGIRRPPSTGVTSRQLMRLPMKALPSRWWIWAPQSI